jgi:hypothetical protein
VLDGYNHLNSGETVFSKLKQVQKRTAKRRGINDKRTTQIAGD